MTGKIVSHYRVLERLGAGGMGVVYKAEDTRLGRTVALKFLPDHFTKDQTALDRFQREARTISALNHPNICTLYDIGEDEGRPFLVMEYLEGQTLRQMLAGQFLKLEEMIEFATQVADGLEAAHSKGVVHRDIKSANIFVNTRGQVKIMDFGLAKLAADRAEAETGDPGLGRTLTASLDLTGPGTTLGTVSYMSPEQARGEKLDARTDLFSFGVVLYEMATGLVPFHGNTPAVVFDAVLNRTPAAPSQLRPDMPPALEHLIALALEKDREERFQSASEMRAALKRMRRDAGVASATGIPISAAWRLEAPPPPKRIRKRVWPAAVAAPLLVAAIGFGLWRWLGPQPAPFQRMQISRLTASGNVSLAAISSDGRYVVHVVSEAGKQSLWMRQVAASSNVQIAPPAQASYRALKFSRDGNSIYFVKLEGQARAALYEMPLLGGVARRVVTDVGDTFTLSPDGKRLAFLRLFSFTQVAVMVANADGSGERLLATRKRPDYFEPSLAWSPDGKNIACLASFLDPQRGTIFGLPVDGGPERPLTAQWWWGPRAVEWLPDGSGLIVAARDPSWAPGQIWHVSYPSGEARRITNDLNWYMGLSLTAAANTLATTQSDQTHNVWVAAAGNAAAARRLTSGANRYDGTRGLAWTPDGKIVYSSRASGNYDLWIMDADSANPRLLTTNARTNVWPRVTADGKYIVFYSDRTGTLHVWRMDIDGNNPKQLTFGKGETFLDCTPDSQWVVYTSVGVPLSLWKVPILGGEPVRVTERWASWPSVSQDGKLLAHGYDDPQAKPARGTAVTPFGGGAPLHRFDIFDQVRWSVDSRALLFLREQNGVGNVWSQPLDGSPPRQLTDFQSDSLFGFDRSRDGRHLAFSRGSENSDVVLIQDLK